MHPALVIAPTATHLAAAILCILLWGRVRAQRALSLAACAASLAFAGVLLAGHADGETITSLAVGGWAAPYGITMVADLFGSIMVLLTAVTGLSCVVFAVGSIDARRERHGFHALVQAMLAAVCGAFVAGDLFNMYVWFEIMLMSSFVLLTLAGRRPQLEGAIKYVALNLVSSTIFLVAVGLLYGVVGTLNLADMAVKLRAYDNPELVTTIATLFLVAFGIKAGAFPLFFWLPSSYHTPPPAVSALFAGLLTKVGVYALVRVFSLVFTEDRGFTGQIMLWVAGLTMLSGALGALCQREVRRALSFQLIGSIGYMLMGLGVAMIAGHRADELAATLGEQSGEVALLRGAAVLGIAGAVFYTAHHMIVKTDLFLLAGLIQKIRGTGELARVGGLFRERPGLALLFFVSALSLVGMPLFSGFWSKLALVRGGVQAETFAVVAVALLASVLGLVAIMRVWSEMFWKAQPTDAELAGAPAPAWEPEPMRPSVGRWAGPLMTAPAVTLAALTVAIGLGAGPAYTISERAARQLLEPSRYIEAVLPQDYRDDLERRVREIEAARADAAAGGVRTADAGPGEDARGGVLP